MQRIVLCQSVVSSNPDRLPETEVNWVFGTRSGLCAEEGTQDVSTFLIKIFNQNYIGKLYYTYSQLLKQPYK
jgi:hypothetical protein